MHLERATTSPELLDVLRRGEPFLHVEQDPLVSSDWAGQSASAAIDSRFTWADEAGHARICLFYDNNWSYGQRLADVVRHVSAGEGSPGQKPPKDA